MNWTKNKDGSGFAALLPHPSGAAGPDAEMGQAAEASVKFVCEHYRWLLLILPIYAILAHGLAAAPLAAVLAIAVTAYNGMLRLASRRWDGWVNSRALYLRCVEIGLICIGFSLLYVKDGSLDDHRFYYDGFYAIFVALAALTAGRKGVFTSAIAATLAVGIGQIMLTPSSPAFFSTDGIAYWISVALSVGTFGLYFIAIGLLAYLYTDFQLHRLGPSLQQRSTAEGPWATLAIIRDLYDRQRIVQVAAQRERLATVGEVTAGVLHELSTPLTGINALVDELVQLGGNVDRSTLDMIKDESARASKIVRGLLQFVHHDANRSAVHVNDAVVRALKLSELRHNGDNVEVIADLSPDAPHALATSSRLQQVISNLVENARHAVVKNGGGRVIVRTRACGETVAVEVLDDGPGIPREIRERIFEPFFTTKQPGIGTGLGLAIVQSIVADLGGRLRLSTNGQGTTFTVILEAGDPDHI